VSQGNASPLRNCDGCTLCCKVMGVEELSKRPGVACAHCAENTGCRIYAARPEMCRSFHCYYLQNAELDERWKPSTANFCMALEPGRLVAYVDEAHPDSWRAEPYFGQLRAWAARNLARGWQVIVAIGDRRVAIVPDGAVDLGVVPMGATITVRASPSGWTAAVE
jgi:Fe-S-cluster containining protein